MRKLEILSPAKLNLYLKVIRKRKDDYHEIVTVFERIALADRILLEKTGKQISLASNRKDLPLDETNLAFKAALFFSRELKKDFGVKIRILKNIPLGAGLGGGSSNAAAVLLGINRLYELGLDISLLVKWAKSIGSDINFFLSERNFALGKGRGEKIYPLNLDTQLWQVLVYPNITIYTKDIYNTFEIGLTKEAPDVKILLTALRENNLDAVGRTLFNSLEEVVLRKYPLLSFWKNKLLSAGAKGVLVSGSGSSIFGVFSNRKEAEAVKRELDKIKGAKIFAASTY